MFNKEPQQPAGMSRREFIEWGATVGAAAAGKYLLSAMGLWPYIFSAPGRPEAVGTKEVENPWYDYVFAQICGMIPDGDKNSDGVLDLKFACAEPWAGLPFPGGCSIERNNYLGTGTCAVTVVAYEINRDVPVERIWELTGYPGLTPDMVAWMIYPHVSPGFDLTCGGAGVELLYPTLKFFGLRPETIFTSEENIPNIMRGLAQGVRLIVSFKGFKFNAGSVARSPDRSTWQVAQHFTIAEEEAVLANGVKSFRGPDSYYFIARPANPLMPWTYLDLSQEARHNVTVLNSSVIMANPDKPNGTEYYIAGAFTVTSPASWGDIRPVYVEPVNSDWRIGRRKVSWPREIKLVSQPVLIGPDRWLVEIDHRGERGNFFYYSDGGGKFPAGEEFNFRYRYYQLPAYMQLDPRWGLVGSGQTITASLLSAKIGGEDGGEVTPDGVHRGHFGGRRQIETEIGELVPIWKLGGYMEKKIETVDDIYATLRRGELVVLQGRVNFGWWNARNENVDHHYQLFWGLNKSGDILAYDPLWGVFPIRKPELQFYDIKAMLALNRAALPKQSWKRR